MFFLRAFLYVALPKRIFCVLSIPNILLFTSRLFVLLQQFVRLLALYLFLRHTVASYF